MEAGKGALEDERANTCIDDKLATMLGSPRDEMSFDTDPRGWTYIPCLHQVGEAIVNLQNN